MLQFIFGRPASGKTYTVLENIKIAADSGRHSVLIVPEQFSFESEKAVLKRLGDRASLSVSVISFSRLYDEVGRLAGGIAGVTLSDADKVIFMNRALLSVTEDLKLWKRYCNSAAFAKTMLDAIGELKLNAVSAEELIFAAENTQSNSLKDKLTDIALIYRTYDALTGEKFIDPVDKLTKLYRSLENCRYFEGKEVFIDSFKGFTGQQYKIINRILSQADNLTVSITNDPVANREYNIFFNVREAVQRIRKSAARFSVLEKQPITLSRRTDFPVTLAAVEKLISGEEISSCINDDALTVCSAATPNNEAEFAARTIRKLVREKGYRYRDFVIIARDDKQYENAVSGACLKNGIRCFTDKRVPLAAFPVAVAVNAAVNVAVKLSTENILRFYKSGLGNITADEVSLLENYTYLWNIEGDAWNTEWVMDPRGFVSGNKSDTKQLKKLEEINKLREKALRPLLKFSKNFTSNAANMSAAIVNLLDDCKAAETLALMAENFCKQGQDFSSDVLKLSFERYMRLLDSLVICYGEKRLDKREFADSLTLAVSFDSVGQIPKMLDEVTFGAADRIRPSRPKITFILGANQGVFPKNISHSGIFAVNERKNLIDMGIDIPDNSISVVTDENFLVYTNLCCASDKLYICYCNQTLTGEKCERSSFVGEICNKIECKKITEPNLHITTENAPETEAAAYSEYCRRISDGNASEIKEALKGTCFENKISYNEAYFSQNKNISTGIAQKLFGNEIKMSASKAETYSKCPFSFFLRYGLETEKLQPAEFDSMQRGTIVHYVLERAISTYKKELASMTREEINEICEKYIDEYLDSVKGYRMVETAKLRFLVSRISRSLKDVLWQIAREFAQTDFEPVSCELKIGDKIPPLKVPFDGGSLLLTGSIDRVDEYNGYIRIVDYKTNDKKFKLPDVLFGLNMQMLIYLYTVVREAGLDDSMAAGILYMPAKRDLNDSGMAMNGLIKADEDIIGAMDKEKKGEFIPKLVMTNSGDINKNCNSFVPNDYFTDIFNYIELIMSRTGKHILNGDFEVNPIDGRQDTACGHCNYASVCGRENTPANQVPKLSNEQVIKEMREMKNDGI